MRVFVTGATGFIGSAVVRELQAAGHSVLGLARNDAAAETLAAMGAEAHRGDLSDHASLAAGARAADGVAHLAFNHDFANSTIEASSEIDGQVVRAMLVALEATDKPFVVTSGTALLASSRTATEDDAPPSGYLRAASEEAALEFAGRGVRTSIVRLPPSVHGTGEKGFVPMLIEVARRTGFAAYVGDGDNRWPAVHRFDAARLYRLALEGAAPGARFHGTAEEGVPMRGIAGAIGSGLGVPVRSLSADEAAAHFGWFAGFAAIDNPTSSAVTRETLGWTPQEADLLADIRDGGYFA